MHMKNMHTVKPQFCCIHFSSYHVFWPNNLQKSLNALVQKKETWAKTFKQTGYILCQSDHAEECLSKIFESASFCDTPQSK